MNNHPSKYVFTTILVLAVIIYFVVTSAIPYRFHQFRTSFLDQYFADNPITATRIGIHDYDGQLPHFDPTSINKQISLLKQAHRELLQIDQDKLDINDRIDYRILDNALLFSIFQWEDLKEYTWNPLFFLWSLGYGYESLMAYDFGSGAERAQSLVGRLERTPVFLDQAMSLLGPMPLPHIETAIQQGRGLIDMLGPGIEKFAADLEPELKDEVITRAEEAAQAIDEFVKFLENRKENGPHRDFRLGQELYRKKLAFMLNEGLSADEVLLRAEAELKFVQGEMIALAVPLYEQWFGEVPDTGSHDAQLRLVRRVLDRIADDHVRREEVVENVRVTIDELIQFIKTHHIVTLDPSKPLNIRETPEYQRGVSIASLQAPGPLEKNLKTYYNVSPIPGDWDNTRAESFLREYNRIAVKILSIHEAYPGHFVQQYYANRHPSLVRAVFPSGVMIEGWAHYCEGMMIQEGFGQGDPRYALVEKKWKLRGIANAIIDQQIHAGNMTREEALELMVRETFQEKAEASAKWRRAQLTSAQLSTYFVGNGLMWDLRRDVEEQSKTKFNLKSFHEKLLSYGSIPIRFLHEAMH